MLRFQEYGADPSYEGLFSIGCGRKGLVSKINYVAMPG